MTTDSNVNLEAQPGCAEVAIELHAKPDLLRLRPDRHHGQATLHERHAIVAAVQAKAISDDGLQFGGGKGDRAEEVDITRGPGGHALPDL